METTLTYDAAYTELKQIASEIDAGEVPVDVLAEKVKRASFLISYCQEKLKSSEAEVNKIIGKMGTEGNI
jgi:exodeoxyribonuclease VII small subunit